MHEAQSRFRRPSAEEQIVLREMTLKLLVSRKDIQPCDEILTEHHYLHSAKLVGEQLRYAVIWKGQWLAVATWSAPALHLKARDRFASGLNPVPPRCRAKAGEIGSLMARLRRDLPEFRRQQALGYPIAGMLALIAMASFSGVTQGVRRLGRLCRHALARPIARIGISPGPAHRAGALSPAHHLSARAGQGQRPEPGAGIVVVAGTSAGASARPVGNPGRQGNPPCRRGVGQRRQRHGPLAGLDPGAGRQQRDSGGAPKSAVAGEPRGKAKPDEIKATTDGHRWTQRGFRRNHSSWTAAGSAAPRRFRKPASARKAVSPLRSATAVQILVVRARSRMIALQIRSVRSRAFPWRESLHWTVAQSKAKQD